MRYIKKIGTPFETCGVQQTQELIDKHWNQDEGKYINLSYDRSRLDDLAKILVDEQRDNEHNSYCCYCMRKLYLDKDNGRKSNVTLEHIIPHKIKEEDWLKNENDYIKFENLNSSHVVVCFNGELTCDQRNNKINRCPYPHFVSYHNLVASCDGKTLENHISKISNCCNNKRGDKFVLPIFLDKELANGIGYSNTGALDYDDYLYDELWFDKDHLNLNNKWITLVRKLWHKIAKSEYNVQSVELAIEDKNLRQDIIDDIDNENEIAAWCENNEAWHLLSEYSWFYQYYKNKP